MSKIQVYFVPGLAASTAKYSIIYNREDMVDWLSGKGFIQDSLPYLTMDERELLISRTCGNCFDKMFPPDLDIDE